MNSRTIRSSTIFSEQQIVDCSTSSGNYGCGGGSLRNTLKYVEAAGGLMAYTDYPYTAEVGGSKMAAITLRRENLRVTNYI